MSSSGVVHQPGYLRESGLPRLRVSEMGGAVARLGFSLSVRMEKAHRGTGGWFLDGLFSVLAWVCGPDWIPELVVGVQGSEDKWVDSVLIISI